MFENYGRQIVATMSDTQYILWCVTAPGVNAARWVREERIWREARQVLTHPALESH